MTSVLKCILFKHPVSKKLQKYSYESHGGNLITLINGIMSVQDIITIISFL